MNTNRFQANDAIFNTYNKLTLQNMHKKYSIQHFTPKSRLTLRDQNNIHHVDLFFHCTGSVTMNAITIKSYVDL